MVMTTDRLFAESADEASARGWGRHPRALAIALRYLYVGWWEYTVVEEVA